MPTDNNNKIFCLLNNLFSILSSGYLSAHWIAREICDYVYVLEDSDSISTPNSIFQFYDSLDEAKNNQSNKTSGIVELNLNTLTSINTANELIDAIKQEELIFIDQLTSCITGIYLYYTEFIPVEDFDSDVVEKKYLAMEATTNVAIEDKFLLKTPYFLLLSKMPKELWPLYSIDYTLYVYDRETWVHYHKREPGCIHDWFNTFANMLENLQHYFPVNLKSIEALNQSLTKCLSTNSQKTMLRNHYNFINLGKSIVTLEGVVALIHRIKQNNLETGFAIGEFKKANIARDFFLQLSRLETKLSKSELTKSELNEIANQIALKVIKKFKLDIKNEDQKQIFINNVKEVCFNSLEDFFKLHDDLKDLPWKKISEKLSSHAEEKCRLLSPLEYEFCIKYSRENAALRLETVAELSDKEIKTAAEKIINSLAVRDKNICFFPPEANLAKQWAEEAINEYNRVIKQVISPTDVIRCCVELVQRLEQLHLFHDGNCRTCYFLLNVLLVLHGIKPTILYDPNRLDCFDTEAMCEQVKQGIVRYDYLIQHREEIQKQYQGFLKNCLQFHNIDYSLITSHYDDICNPLVETIHSFNRSYLSTIGHLRAWIMKVENTSPLLFFYKNKEKKIQNILHCIEQLKKSFTTFKKTNDIVTFIKEVGTVDFFPIELASCKTEFNNIIKSLKKLSGMQEHIAWKEINQNFMLLEDKAVDISTVPTMRRN